MRLTARKCNRLIMPERLSPSEIFVWLLLGAAVWSLAAKYLAS